MSKWILEPKTFANAVSMGASFTSDSISLRYLDRALVQVSCTGTPTGTLTLEGSNNNIDWFQLPELDLAPLVGAPETYVIDVTVTAFMWLRIGYLRTAGAGSCTAIMTGKST